MADAEIDAKPVDQDALVADIDRTRTELARTIDAISDRVSPKKNVSRAMEQVRQRASQIDPVMAGAAAIVALGVTGLFLWRRRRH
jgi:MYXO-CTERM domain-containing protein